MLLLITLFFSFLLTTPHEVAAGTAFLTGSKTFEITDYSIVKKGISNGNYIQSDTFTVGGYQWAIKVYPQGDNSSYSDSVSIYIWLTNPRNVVKAISTHRLRDWSTSTWSTNTPSSNIVNIFSLSGFTSWGYHSFIRHSDLENSTYLRNDTLLIKTTLWVAQDSSSMVLSTVAGHLYGWWQKFLPIADVSFENRKSVDV